jgi:acetoin utilization deacetylase AcuC-like enzyme/GNAT superfamily N-acetyltransferase
LNHTLEYIDAVQHLSRTEDALVSEDEHEERLRLAQKYGFGETDTPVTPGMHEITANIVGGTLVALSAVMGLPEGGISSSEEERPLHVYHPAGGLHHALADRACGMCIYNDISVAIAHVLRATQAKILFIDFDAHHGTGVQRSFYDDPRVMTISLHESGRTLFPATGDVLELGESLGRGYSVNVPLEPFTDDDSYLEVMKTLLPPLVCSFGPDVILSVHGCDIHAWDPLSHLMLTTRGIQAQIKLTHQLAHAYCQGRWVALGGGGFDLYSVVPRAWSMVWAEMSEQPLLERLPEAWVRRWYPAWRAVQDQQAAALHTMGKSSPSTFPTTFLDQPEDVPAEYVPAQPRPESIRHTNQQTAALVRHLFLSPLVRHAFPSLQRPSPLAAIVDQFHVRESATPSRSKTIETEAGPILLRDFCPPSLVRRLTAESGLKAFTHLPEREHQLLLNIVKNPDCALTLAHTPAGEIVGQVTMAPADLWWEGIDPLYEVAIEVSSNWRGQGIASELLAFALERDAIEEMILVAMGLSWHWDTEGLHLTTRSYRELLAGLMASQGFTEYPTNEPNISMEPGNILLARIGKRVNQQVVYQFLNRLYSSPSLSSEWEQGVDRPS